MKNQDAPTQQTQPRPNELWITTSDRFVVILNEQGLTKDSLGQCEVYDNISDMSNRYEPRITSYTRGWLIKQITKETHPEYYL